MIPSGRRPLVAYLGLALRVAVCWWLVLVVLSAFGGSMAFVFAVSLLLGPPVALGIGGAAAFRQWRSLQRWGQPHAPMTTHVLASLDLPLPPEPALRLLQAACHAAFGQAARPTSEHTLDMRVHEAGLPPRAWRGDHVSVRLVPDGAQRSRITLSCAPAWPWWSSGLWIDGGRCARQLDALRAAILARLRGQQEAQDARQHAAETAARLAQAEALLLRAQVEPHFLYNTLAHVRSAVETEPQAALAMLDALVDLLRDASRSMALPQVRLEDELRHVRHYLRLMGLRLGARLASRVDAEAGLETALVPTGAVLVLVENAVKHGIEQHAGPGEIRVICRRADVADVADLLIEVCNDGPPLQAPRAEASVGGLDNLRQRLQLLHGPRARLCIESRDEGGVRAALSLPLMPPEDAT